MRLISAFLLLSLLLAFGCKDDDTVTPVRERSYLHILGAAAPSDTFNITFDYYNADDIVINGFFYKRNFPIGGYADMMAAGTPDEFGNGKLLLTITKNNFINATPDTLLQPSEIVLGAEEKATLVIADSLGSMRSRKYLDVYTNNADANIRFLNLDASVASATFRASNGAWAVNAAPFLGSGDFIQVPVGVYDIEVVNDDTGNVIATVSSYSLSNWGAYTFYLGQGSGGELEVFRH